MTDADFEVVKPPRAPQRPVPLPPYQRELARYLARQRRLLAIADFIETFWPPVALLLTLAIVAAIGWLVRTSLDFLWQ